VFYIPTNTELKENLQKKNETLTKYTHAYTLINEKRIQHI